MPVLPLFAATLFVSATLLFLVQPMFARMLLPLIGGAPAAWNTCVVFFQMALVVGYLYAHPSVKWLGARKQALLHLTLLLLPLAALPIHIGERWASPPPGNPIPWLFLVLLVSVGLPFFAVSTSAPLLQRWFAATAHSSARDPYFLYAASNLGSLLALLMYPLLVEPAFRLTMQSRLWAGGYGLLVLLTAVCGWTMWNQPESALDDRPPVPEADTPVSWTTRVRWLALAAVPSSLMLSVNTYITTDIAAVPLLWVIPLAIYLLTFVIVFARRQILPHRLVSTIFPLAIIPAVIAIVRNDTAGIAAIPVHLLTLFMAALMCHGELARSRPAARRLTEFYLSMSIGGALGGLFNTLVAPLVFTSAAEYPIGIVLACLLRPPSSVFGRPPGAPSRLDRWFDVALPVMLGFVVILLKASAEFTRVSAHTFRGLAHVFALPLAIWLSFWRRPLRLGLGLAALLMFPGLYPSSAGPVVYAERTFFGIHQVVDENSRLKLLNGTTDHGSQLKDEKRSCTPLSYYYPTGPAGQLFASFTGHRAKSSVAIVGLGTAALAAYSKPGQNWTFYEINPAIERLAVEGRYFTYLKRCATRYRIVLGDARRSLAAAPDGFHDVIVLDAFSSDAIPIHLITREAVDLYFHKLRPGGVLAVHISNRYLDLEPVLGGLARDAGLVALIEDDHFVSYQELLDGKLSSTWVVFARRREDLGSLTGDARWKEVALRSGVGTWTDDFSNIISVIKYPD